MPSCRLRLTEKMCMFQRRERGELTAVAVLGASRQEGVFLACWASSSRGLTCTNRGWGFWVMGLAQYTPYIPNVNSQDVGRACAQITGPAAHPEYNVPASYKLYQNTQMPVADQYRLVYPG
eukprot:4473966-Pyramimonas_sp.AAC.1